ncbi:MAG: PD40 domain-containing protein, partial [Bryobacterales bacterium]|nr:PD40 domain-containing protein [Bryobacterales bacterium]
MTRLLPLFVAVSLSWAQQARVYLTEPHVSPNRNEIVFVSGGDIWRVAANGGDATLLVSHPADESRPLFSPDGSQLAFVSTRTGSGDIYILQLASGTTTRLTFDDGVEMLDAWSRDGQWLYFHSSSQDIGRMNDVFRIKATGGMPTPVAADRYTNEFFSAPSPDGTTVVINARGIASQQWWRKGHSNLDRSELWLVKPGSVPGYERISDGAAREIWPMWAPDGKSFFFVSDRTGVENVWRQPIGGTSRQVSQFKEGRVLWPTLSYDGKLMVFERDFTIWKMDPNNGKAASIPVYLRGAAATPSITHQSKRDGFDEMALSPDGKKIAFIVRGEVFAASSTPTDSNAFRVSHTHAHETQLEWAPDSKRIVYVSDRAGPYSVYLYDFRSNQETRLTSSPDSDAAPRFSPDGKFLAYFRGGRAVWVYDFAEKEERQLAAGDMPRQPLAAPKALAWSPDSRYVAFASRGAKGFANVEIAAIGATASKPVSFLSNSVIRNIQFHPSGRYLLFDTAQRTEPRRIARIDLVPQHRPFREDRFSNLFVPASESSDAGATAIDWEQIRSRISFLPIGLDTASFIISPDGKTLLVAASAAGQDNVYTYTLDETLPAKQAPRQLTATVDEKSALHFSADSKEAFFLEKGA